MNAAHDDGRGWRGSKRARLLAGLAILLAGVAAVFVALRQRPHGPKLLNQATDAREVRPLTADPDPRFAPLPLEREKHGK
jgi:hypothetical protein